MKPRLRVGFRDFWHPETEGEIRKNHLFVFLSRRYTLELAEDPDILFFSCFGQSFRGFHGPRFFFTGENFRPDLRVADRAISFEYIDDPRHYRLPLFILTPGIAGLRQPKDPSQVLASKSGFCNFIYSNSRCKVRNDFYHKLSRYKRIDSAGKYLNNTGALLEDTHAALSASGVPAEGWFDEVKLAFQRRFKFTIAFENSSRSGYTTEKLVDAMLADTVPIYWGNPDVHRDFNPESFINCHDYGSLDEVVEYVARVDRDDELYKRYLSQPKLNPEAEATSLNEDAFFDWFDRAASEMQRRRGKRQRAIADWVYGLKYRHWRIRKFGRLSNVWALYRRV